jgi:hypothetical protein
MLTATPSVASVADNPKTGRNVLQRAVSPPSAMITIKAQKPRVRVSSASSNRMPNPDSPRTMPMSR